MYDPNCWAYWCDQCGKEMTIKYEASTEEHLVLECPRCRCQKSYSREYDKEVPGVKG